MAEVEWVKLYTKMFESPKIKKIRRLPEGNNIILMWVMLLVLAGKCNSNGTISITAEEPYDIDSLADELRFDIPVVTLALNELTRYGMIETAELERGIFLRVKNWEEYQNIDGLEKIREQNRLRKARQREHEKQNLLLGKVTAEADECDESRDMSRDVTQQNKNKSIEEDIRNNNTLKGMFQEFAGDDKDLLNALKEYDRMRKSIKRPMTDEAKDRMLSKLKTFPREKWIRILQQSCDNNWVGIFDLKGDDTNGRKQSVHSDAQKSSGEVQDTKSKWHFHYDNDP